MGGNTMMDDAPHLSVLYQPVCDSLNIQPSGRYIDATVGAGGHAGGILQASHPDGRLLGLDADPAALEIAQRRLACFGERATLRHGNFARLAEYARAEGFYPADSIVFDLGLSSMELADSERGFSFQTDGPLDMRFDPDMTRTAADLVNDLTEHELADLIYRYGEETASRAIARAIVAARPLYSTSQLATVISQTVRHRGKIHPATLTFQALRIAVNNELGVLEQGLIAAEATLKPGGRLAVISFHSLEDRIVKQFFARQSRHCICPPEALVCTCGHRASLTILTRKPIRPDAAEIERNPRSRSAKLRIAIKCT